MHPNTFKCKFIERIQRAEDVFSFRFLTEQALTFIPGQFVQVLFDENNLQNKNLNKFLSISSSPQREYIEITKKISESDFSKSLMSLAEGDQVVFKGPMGSCIFEEKFKKLGFLIGGIGITPVISILENIKNKNLSTDVVLLYGNWTEKEVAVKKELDEIQNDSNIKIVYALAEEDIEGFKKGLINQEFIKENMPDIAERMVYVFGPPKMVESLKKQCLDLGVDSNKIKIENFIGY